MEKIQQLLEELSTISPMPSDDDPALTDERLDRFCKIVDELYAICQNRVFQPTDNWMIPILIDSFGPGTLYGCAWSVRHILERFPPLVVRPYLRDSLKSGRNGPRKWSAYLLGVQRNEEDLPSIVAALNDPEVGVRVAALQAIGMIGNPSARTVVEELVNDPVESIAQAAREARSSLLEKERR